MAEVRYVEEGVIAAPVEQVFDYRCDIANLPDYNPNVTNLRRTDTGADAGPGAEYLFDLDINGYTLETPLRVLEVTRPSRFVFETGPAYMARETCSFEGTPDGTRVVFDTTLTIDGDLDEQTAAQLAASGSEQVRIELENMRKILEGA